MRQVIIFITVLVLFSFTACGQGLPEPGVGLTIYNDNFAVVHDIRNIGLVQGMNMVKFTEVPATIIPASVVFQSLSDPKVEVVSQSYREQTMSAMNILEKYVGEDVVVYLQGSGATSGKILEGRLLSVEGNEVVMQTEERIEIFTRDMVENYSLPLPQEDYSIEPAITWQISAPGMRNPLCRISYMARQINWGANYTAIFDPEEDEVALRGWMLLENKSGKDFEGVSLKVVAGDVKMEEPKQEQIRLGSDMYRAAAAPKQVQQREFAEYHIYDVERDVTLMHNESKQIKFIDTPSVSADKKFVYQRYKNPGKVMVKVEFENDPNSGLGKPLPMGTIKMYNKDIDGMLEFVGSDSIDHTTEGEMISLHIGNAFDIVPEHKMLSSEKGRNSRTETHQITLRNGKDEAATVIVEERFPRWVNWEIREATDEYEQIEADKIRFDVRVPAKQAEVIQFTVYQRW